MVFDTEEIEGTVFLSLSNVLKLGLESVQFVQVIAFAV